MLSKALSWIKRLLFGSPKTKAPVFWEIELLHEFLLSQSAQPLLSSPIQQFDKDYFKLPADQMIEQVSALYLNHEQRISEYKPNRKTKADLRDAVRSRFPKLVKLPHFNLIFLSEKEQNVLLGKTFLSAILRGAIHILGKAEDHFFEHSLQWVDRLPEVKQAFPYLPEDPPPHPMTPQYLAEVSQQIASSLEQKMGARFTQRVYDNAYQDIANRYKLLNTFPIIISIIPQQFLDTDKIGLLTKHQLSATLLEKVSFLEDLNQQLGERNVALQSAQEEVRRAQKASEEAYLQLREVMNAVKDGIITANDKSEIIMVNKEVEEIWGYTSAELIGKDLTILMPEKYRSRHSAGMNRYLSTRVSKVLNTNVIMEGLKKGGQAFPLEINISDLEFQGRHLFTAAVRDISARIKAENELKASKALLEQRTLDLEQAQGQLKITIEELKSSNHDLERFAYVASHDLQEPLRTVKGYLNLIKERLGSEAAEHVREYLAYADLGVLRMEQLIQGLLEYSRIGRGASRMVDVKFDDIMTLVRYNLQEQIKASEAVITLDGIPEQLLGNKIQLVQLFQNLISNGIKFVSVGTKPHIQIRCTEGEEHWNFSIQDNGIGIPELQQDEIFEVFKRAHDSRNYQGAGIGLAICKKVVERHGGSIAVESKAGAGTTFSFTLSFIPVQSVL
ncbi:MAG: PAS domain S-box protein [Saprospiraceae bacterium]|nr:PAS domain S-box protein [Saprospiraceae bacterium]